MGKRALGLWLCAAFMAAAGCQTPNPLKKPKMTPEYVLPPADDARFSAPPAYPKEMLDTGQFKKELSKPPTDPTKDAPASFSGPGGRMGG
jgi:hypothetical protein